ncbi:uncharacterized protein LOC113552767 [Rhopalosiphum maidis]|uniref:uncharacterized protein LOC113552767 n=1 Tax=Rhopalosiphum maidis TaxID=43146 RepID=UPI000F006C20|nr:uncharacterized protein LOC113552767 [Rhopalosiphum maidis]
MSKNPFVNCESHEQKKIKGPIVEPKEKLFCPPTIVRLGNEQFEFNSMWFYKTCLKSLLSEDAVNNHLTICNTLSKRDEANPPTKKNEDTHYICETCKKVFARRVTLKKHLEVHEKSSSSIDSEESNDKVEAMDDVDANDGVDLLNTKNENDEDNDDNYELRKKIHEVALI